MESNLQVFSSEEFGEIRTVVENDQVWFVGKDVAEALGYTNTRKALKDHVDEDDKGVTKWYTPGGKQNVVIINESGLYSLVLSSKLPTAKKFKHWVTSEVLPTIRKTGGYVANNDKFLDFYIPDADEATRTKFNMMVEVGKELNRQIRELKDDAKKNEPKVIFYDAVSGSDTSISVREMAKLLNQNGFPIGQKKLFQWLRDNGYLIKVKPDKNDPTQRSMDLGIMEVKESIVCINGDTIVIRRTPKITAKGQQYFIKKFMKEKERECV